MNVTTIPVGMLGTNCYLLASAKNTCAIVDPGAQAAKIADIITEKGLAPKYILLTHGHFDHIGAVNALAEQFPELEIYIGEGDLELIADTEISKVEQKGLDKDTFTIKNAGTVAGGREFELDELTITVMETPGHSKGGVSYICEDVIFSGDTLFQENVGRCDLYGGDFGILKSSLKKLGELTGDFTVYPGHGEATTLEHERFYNPYFPA